jgi:hypothetical protein
MSQPLLMSSRVIVERPADEKRLLGDCSSIDA